MDNANEGLFWRKLNPLPPIVVDALLALSDSTSVALLFCSCWKESASDLFPVHRQSVPAKEASIVIQLIGWTACRIQRQTRIDTFPNRGRFTVIRDRVTIFIRAHCKKTNSPKGSSRADAKLALPILPNKHQSLCNPLQVQLRNAWSGMPVSLCKSTCNTLTTEFATRNGCSPFCLSVPRVQATCFFPLN